MNKNKIDMEEKMIDLLQNYGLGDKASNACVNDILDLFSDVGESVGRCAFSVYVNGCGTLIVIAKDEKELAEKMKKEGFTKPFKIIKALSFIS